MSYLLDGAPAAGVLVGDRVHAATALLRGTEGVDASSVLRLLETWPRSHEALAGAAAQAADLPEGRPLAEVEVLAPVLHPRALFCAGANYWDHIEEMEGTIDRSKRAAEPWLFQKAAAHSIVADGVPVAIPSTSKQLDWEAELAVVIGREARDVAAQDASGVIAGYTIINDLSARDLMTRDDRPAAMTFDWVGQKSFTGAAPMGPWITPTAYIDDPHELSIRLWVNDVLKQDSNTRELVHDCYELVEWLSHHLTLLPGDVIATGTPSGVGMPRQDFLRPGDTMTIEIEGCGRLVTPVA